MIPLGESDKARAVELNQQGEQLFSSGKLPGAIDRFMRAIELFPDYATPYNNLGVVVWRIGFVVGAYTYFQRALAIFPDHPGAALNLSDVLLQMGRTDDAVATLRNYCERNPEDSEAQRRLTLLLNHVENQGNGAEATDNAGPVLPVWEAPWNSLGPN
ncbi:MAG: tetratricopeptide repeat protein [Deltaproteobacteria bacterium]|nr:tetratricopeptide repeat protein [Deltaproteobacteria bacterium]